MNERVEKILAVLADGEAALIESGANRFYLTGFSSSAGYVLVTRKGAYFIVDFRYEEKARACVTSAKVILMENPCVQIAERMQADGASVLYVETESTSLSAFARLKKNLPGVILANDDKIDRALAKARAVKSAEELECIREAQRMTDETFAYILDRIAVGRTEREVMLDMEFFMRRMGSEGVAFDFIVVSGANSSLPHGVPTDKRIKRGDFITMDFGAVYKGYRSDMTRTVAVSEVSEEQRRVYDTVLAAQAASLAAIRAGAKCRDVDAAARDLINEAGYTGCFGHGLGHSVGIDIHESPACSPRSETTLKSHMLMTVEPGVYLEGKFGVRIEDLVVVTENGYENLTKSEKKLILL
ncbi:MAG: aminopeptidase P family protein [Clostridia bacterium]|nr:aminopeptidase P family protein [Clostridia bacterium]